MSAICAIVLDYFGAERTERCLRSLVGQGVTEAYVVDNSGESDYQERLSQRMESLRTDVDFRIRYAANIENIGFGRAINRALEIAGDRGAFEYYLLINNDAQAETGMLAALESVLRADPGAGMVAPRTQSGSRAFCGFWYQRHTGLIAKRSLPGAFHYLSGACLLVSSELTESGLFDKAFFMYGEDVELGWRVRRGGFRPRCVEEARLRHIGVGSSHEGKLFYEYHVLRGHFLLASRLSKHPFEYPLLWFGRLVALSFRTLLRCIRFRSAIPFLALMMACLPVHLAPDPRNKR